MIALTALVVLCVAPAQIPIPRTVDGHHYGIYGSQVHLEMFIDIVCDDTRYAWPQVRGLFDHYTPGQLEISIHHLPLVFHRNAFNSAVMIEAVASQAPDKLWEALDSVFANNDQISNDATAGMNDTQVLDLLTDIGSQFGVDRETFTAAFQWNSPVFMVARNGFKYSLQHGAIGGTPWFVINGISAADSSAMGRWTTKQWISYLDQFFAPSSPRKTAVHHSVVSEGNNVLMQTQDGDVKKESGCSDVAPCPRVEAVKPVIQPQSQLQQQPQQQQPQQTLEMHLMSLTLNKNNHQLAEDAMNAPSPSMQMDENMNE